MPRANQDLQDLIEQLQHKSSSKRRAAARSLRKLKATTAGPQLLAALKNELKDRRTWETQYQMIMALGESGYIDSLDFLHQLADQELEASMIYIAIGHSIASLLYLTDSSVHKAIEFVLKETYDPLLSDGVLRAIAVQKMIPIDKDIDDLLAFADNSNTPDNSTTWIVSASAGWHRNEKTMPFLHKNARSENQQTKKAAEAALKKEYVNWSIL